MADKHEPITQDLSISVQLIEQRIYFIRNQKVMLDSDLAELYQVETKALNQAVKRNIERFPEDFCFQLDKEEYDSLRSQLVTIASGRGQHSKYLPYAFTEQGIAMLSSVLRSQRAIQVNIAIMRAFVKLRQFLVSNEELVKKVEQLAQLQDSQSTKLKKHDDQITAIFDAIKKIIKATVVPKTLLDEQPKRIAGFVNDKKDNKKK